LYWIVAKRVAADVAIRLATIKVGGTLEDTSVENCIPSPIQTLIDTYLQALEPLRYRFYGMYISGSIAFGAFEELESDIDIVALTHGECSTPELAQLNVLHAELIGTHQFAKRLEVLYIPLQSLGMRNAEIAPYPTVKHGEFSPAGYGDLNSITWWTVKNNGIRLLGPERSTLPLDVTWQNVLETMRDTLDGFWVSKARRPHRLLRDTGQLHLHAGKKPGRLRKTEQLLNVRSRDMLSKALEQVDALVLLRDALVLLRDDWCVFAVATHCRMLTTIEEGEIIPKSVALKRWRDCLPARWRPLIDEAWRIRHHLGGSSLYRSRLKRAREVLAFIKYIRKRGEKVVEVLPSEER
jgi:hypothetical protein